MNAYEAGEAIHAILSRVPHSEMMQLIEDLEEELEELENKWEVEEKE